GSLLMLSDERRLQGGLQEAIDLSRASLRIYWELGQRFYAARALEHLATAHGLVGELDGAVRVEGAADRLRQLMGTPRTGLESRAREELMGQAKGGVGGKGVSAGLTR